MSFIQIKRTAVVVALIMAISAIAYGQDKTTDDPAAQSTAQTQPVELSTEKVAQANDAVAVLAPASSSSRQADRTADGYLYRSVRSPFESFKETTDSTPIPQTPDPDEWQFQLTPYLWIAGISGNAGIGNLVVDVNAGLGDSDIHLNFGFMGAFEARKGRWIILTDLQYSNLGTDRPTPGPGIIFTQATADFKTFILDPEVGYRVVDAPEKGAFVDVLGGIRYWHLRTDLTFNSPIIPAVSVTRSRGWVDAVVGIRGKTHISKKWFVSGKADLGGGGSQFTYQLLGVGGVMITKSVALIGGYRALSVDYDRDNFLFDMVLHGPIMGVGFKF